MRYFLESFLDDLF
jgi:hypothetical protein